MNEIVLETFNDEEEIPATKIDGYEDFDNKAAEICKKYNKF